VVTTFVDADYFSQCETRPPLETSSLSSAIKISPLCIVFVGEVLIFSFSHNALSTFFAVGS